MSLVRLDKVSKSFSGAPILRDVSIRIEAGEKLGLVGRNGTGKTTLFRMILGDTEPDGGEIERMRKARFSYLSQMPQLDAQDSIWDVALGPFRELIAEEAELERLERRMAEGEHDLLHEYSVLQERFHHRGGYDFRHRVKRVLQGLGFRETEFDLPAAALSGGQRTRLMLALVLLEDADLLLLDEPENHLDIEAREWLEAFLQETPRAVCVVSHDRRLLNAVVQRVAEIDLGELRIFTGNYEAYRAAKALIRDQQQKTFDRQQEMIEKDLRFVERFRYKATKARQVQSRLKRLDKIERVEAPPPEAPTVRFNLGEVVRSGAVVLDAQGLGMAYGDLTLYRDISFQLERGERIGIIGPNGSGKTTLLRQLAGRLEGCSGSVKVGHKVAIGFYDQHHEDLNLTNDVFSEILSTRPEMTPEQVRSFMARFLFRGEDIFKSVGTLSGGERSRVALAKLILSQANVLLLDEPTNHLDIASREAIEDALAAFPGSLIVVSHDRALVDRLVRKLIIIERGRCEIYLGNYAEYRERGGRERVTTPPAAAAPLNADEVLRIRREEKPKAKRVDREEERARDRERRKQKNQLSELEQDIEAIEEQIEAIESQFTGIDPSDYQKLQRLKDEYDGLKRDLADMYAEWEVLAEGISK